MKNIKSSYVCVIGIPEGQEKQGWYTKCFWTFCKYDETIKPHIQESQEIPSKRNMKKLQQGTS